MQKELTVLGQLELGILGKKLDFYGSIEEPLFLAKDIAEWIDHTDVSKMIKSADEDEKLVGTLFLSGQKRQTWFLTEDGVYEVLMQSRKPVAKKLKKDIKLALKEIRQNGVYVSDSASYEQVIYNVDTFISNLDNYNVTKLYTLIEDFLNHHRDKKTRLRFKRNHKSRHGNKKLKTHIESMQEIRDYLVDYLTVQINHFNSTNQSGLSQEYIRIREMVRVNVENMKFRTAACKK